MTWSLSDPRNKPGSSSSHTPLQSRHLQSWEAGSGAHLLRELSPQSLLEVPFPLSFSLAIEKLSTNTGRNANMPLITCPGQSLKTTGMLRLLRGDAESGCLEFKFGKQGPGGGVGLGKELFSSAQQHICPRNAVWSLRTRPWGRRPQKGCTHRKVAGQELPVLLSKLPHQGPQLLILPTPERELSSHGCRSSLIQPFSKTCSEPGATTHLEGLTVQRETDANPRLPQTKVKPRCRGQGEVCGTCLFREEKGQAHSKKSSVAGVPGTQEREMQAGFGGDGRAQTTRD